MHQCLISGMWINEGPHPRNTTSHSGLYTKEAEEENKKIQKKKTQKRKPQEKNICSWIPETLDHTTGCSWLCHGNTAGIDMGTGHMLHSGQRQPSSSTSCLGASQWTVPLQIQPAVMTGVGSLHQEHIANRCQALTCVLLLAMTARTQIHVSRWPLWATPQDPWWVNYSRHWETYM